MSEWLFASHKAGSGEKPVLSMLLVQSFFLGIFLGAFDISAHSLFLSVFDEKMLARGYVVSGLAGIIFISSYKWLQTRTKFRTLEISGLLFVTLVTFAIWIILVKTMSVVIIFVFFALLGPLNILVMMGLRTRSEVMLSISQNKKSFGITDKGLIAGIIFICFLIPLLLSFGLRTHYILLAGAIAALIATVIQIVNTNKQVLSDENAEIPAGEEEKRSVFRLFIEDRSVRLIGIFIALSVMTLFFVQYSFLAVTREQYPEAGELAKFLGLFTGSMMILILLGKLFVFSVILHNYGLRSSLIILPVLLFIFTGIAVTTGTILGYTHESASGFLIFFILLALSRLFSKVLKDTVETPSYNIIYLTIDGKIRHNDKPNMSGSFNEIAIFSSGLILSGIGMLGFIRLIHFSVILLFIILAWIFVALKVYSEYRKSIHNALEEIKKRKPDRGEDWNEVMYGNRFAASLTFKRDYFNLISGDFSILERKRNKLYFETLFTRTLKNNDVSMLPALRRIVGTVAIDKEIRHKATEISELLKQNKSDKEANNSWEQRVKNLLSGPRMPQTSEILRLLRDNRIESKRQAIHIIGKFSISDLLPEVCECLSITGLEKDVIAVFKVFGEKASSSLIRTYLVSSGNEAVSLIILRLLGNIGNEESKGFLFSRIWSNSRLLREEALTCLIRTDFQPVPEERNRLFQLVSETIGYLTWNLSAKICLEKQLDNFLLRVMKKETERWEKFLFNILAVIYDSASIDSLKKTIDIETIESTNYALEMIDMMMDESIKYLLISYFDDVPKQNKIRTLHRFFRGHVPQYHGLLDDLLNRDYNLISLWTKVCTLRSIPGIEGEKMKESVIAMLFSPDEIIQEEVARLIARSDMKLYESVTRRIPDLVKNRLDIIIRGEREQESLLYEKVTFLAGCFKGLVEDNLIGLAENMSYESSINSVLNNYPEGAVLWPLSTDGLAERSILFYDKETFPGETGENLDDDQPCYLLPLKILDEFIDRFPGSSGVIMKYIDASEIQSMSLTEK